MTRKPLAPVSIAISQPFAILRDPRLRLVQHRQMASLSLPPPRNIPSESTLRSKSVQASAKPSLEAKKPATRGPPSYNERCQAASALAGLTPQERKKTKLFVPRSIEDFGDGGAFPEIHVAQ